MTPSTSNKVPLLSVNTNDATGFAKEIREKYPELEYLANPNVSVTSEGAALIKENEPVLPSQQSYPEFDRSIQSLRSLHWIISDDDAAYGQFISSQDEPKLSRASFKSLHDFYRNLEDTYISKGWKPGDLQRTLEVALVMGDFGKSDTLRDELRRYKITAVDHDDFYAQLMQSGTALKEFKSFQALPEPAQELLKKTSDLAHFGHITHLEGGAQMFAGIEQSELLKSEPEAFDFAWLVYLFDVAGALGHIFKEGSKVLNQATFENRQLTYKACTLLLKEPNQNRQTAIHQLVNIRSTLLEIDRDSDLDALDRQVLARLSAMLRVPPLDKEKGKQLVEAYRSLNAELKIDVRRELSLAAADSLPLTPTYVPAMLVNAVAHAQKTGKDLRSALETSLTLLCKGLSLYRQGIKDRSISEDIRLDFNYLSGLISKGEHLDADQLRVDRKNGKVFIQNKNSVSAFSPA